MGPSSDVWPWQDPSMKIDVVTMMRRDGIIIGKLVPEKVVEGVRRKCWIEKGLGAHGGTVKRKVDGGGLDTGGTSAKIEV